MNVPKLFVHCGMLNANYVYIMDELLEMVEKSGMSNDIDLVVSTVGTPDENRAAPGTRNNGIWGGFV